MADGARDGAIPLLRLDDPLAERRRVAHALMMIEVEQETMEISCPGFLVTANTGEVVARINNRVGGATFSIQRTADDGAGDASIPTIPLDGAGDRAGDAAIPTAPLDGPALAPPAAPSFWQRAMRGLSSLRSSARRMLFFLHGLILVAWRCIPANRRLSEGEPGPRRSRGPRRTRGLSDAQIEQLTRLIDHQTRRGGNATNAEEEGADGFLNVP